MSTRKTSPWPLPKAAAAKPVATGPSPTICTRLEKVFARLKKAHPGAELRVCDEAGPTGFVLARRCAQLRIHCTVVAPLAHPEPRWGPGEDGPARRAQAGPAASGRRVERGARARGERRSHARSLPGAHRCRAGLATWPCATQSLPVAPRLSLQRQERLE